MNADPILNFDEAHRRVAEFARELSREGFTDDVIADALLGIGTKGFARLGGRDHCAGVLRQAADVIEAGGTFGRQH